MGNTAWDDRHRVLWRHAIHDPDSDIVRLDGLGQCNGAVASDASPKPERIGSGRGGVELFDRSKR